MPSISAIPLPGVPLIHSGMDLAAEICAAVERSGEVLGAGDVVVIAQKIVSKSEGRIVSSTQVEPGEEARSIAQKTNRDARAVQLILSESTSLLRATSAAIIARHRTGHVLANAGIDLSNVGGEPDAMLLWPHDPDASARAIRDGIVKRTGIRPAVVIADSMGRAWRIGTVGSAIGCAGLTVVEDKRGTGRDLFGRVLQATQIGVADSIAALATLAMGESDEGTPVALVRGADGWVCDEDGPGATSGLRPVEQDMFQ